MKKKVLVYPCGTEIGLEIYKALCCSTHYELWGGLSNKDHGEFIYKHCLGDLPFITDNSTADEIKEFNRCIKQYQFDFIYPAMDGVITIFSKYRDELTPTLVAPNFHTNEVTRSKQRTYKLFNGKLPVPHIYDNDASIKSFPVFIKPDVGQGSQGAKIIPNENVLLMEKQNLKGKLILEYLPGEEYTIDCFTNNNKRLIFARGRLRRRIKSGISMNTIYIDDQGFQKMAEVINNTLDFRGAWFFQVKRSESGKLTLLEIASRIAGTSAIARNIGVNLPLLTLELFNQRDIDSVICNKYNIELDRALENKYRIDLNYESVYIDFDDTIIIDGQINLDVIRFLYQCVNRHKKIILLTKHVGDIIACLKNYKIADLFDEIIHLKQSDDKKDFIKYPQSIFVDDSYNERKAISEAYDIPVFDTHMVECLIETQG